MASNPKAEKSIEVVYWVRGDIAPSRSHIKCVHEMDAVKKKLNELLAKEHKSVLRVTSTVELPS